MLNLYQKQTLTFLLFFIIIETVRTVRLKLNICISNTPKTNATMQTETEYNSVVTEVAGQED